MKLISWINEHKEEVNDVVEEIIDEVVEEIADFDLDDFLGEDEEDEDDEDEEIIITEAKPMRKNLFGRKK